MYSTTVTIGTLERACQFVQLCNRMRCKIELEADDFIIDAKSLMGLFSLNLEVPLHLRARCDDNEVGAMEEQFAPYLVH